MKAVRADRRRWARDDFHAAHFARIAVRGFVACASHLGAVAHRIVARRATVRSRITGFLQAAALRLGIAIGVAAANGSRRRSDQSTAVPRIVGARVRSSALRDRRRSAVGLVRDLAAASGRQRHEKGDRESPSRPRLLHDERAFNLRALSLSRGFAVPRKNAHDPRVTVGSARVIIWAQ